MFGRDAKGKGRERDRRGGRERDRMGKRERPNGRWAGLPPGLVVPDQGLEQRVNLGQGLGDPVGVVWAVELETVVQVWQVDEAERGVVLLVDLDARVGDPLRPWK